MVAAFGRAGHRPGHAQARTDADGTYEMNVNPDEAYAVYVDDKEWVAPSRSTSSSDRQAGRRRRFSTRERDLIRGLVTVGPDDRPVLRRRTSSSEEVGDDVPRICEKRATHGATSSQDLRRKYRRPGPLHDPSRSRHIHSEGAWANQERDVHRQNEPELVRDFHIARTEKRLAVREGDRGAGWQAGRGGACPIGSTGVMKAFRPR